MIKLLFPANLTARNVLAPKDATGSKSIVASRKSNTKALSKEVAKGFKSFHGKLHFYSDYKTFRVVENSTPVIDSLTVWII